MKLNMTQQLNANISMTQQPHLNSAQATVKNKSAGATDNYPRFGGVQGSLNESSRNPRTLQSKQALCEK